MPSTWKSLIWKEWHEHKWVLAALTCITTFVFGVFSFALSPASYADEFATIMLIGTSLPMLCLAVYVAAMEASGEQERGTYALWQSLPVPMMRVAICKVSFGLLTCLVPGFAAALAIWACPGSPIRDTVSLTDLFALTIGSANYYAPASIFIWSIVLAIHGRDEIGALARALALIFGLWTLILFSTLFVHDSVVRLWGTVLLRAAMPGGICLVVADGVREGEFYGTSVLAALVVHVGLLTWFCRRYGQTVTHQVIARSPIVGAVSMASSKSPFSTQLIAVVWKQCREGAPITVAIFAGVVALTAVYTIRDWQPGGNPGRDYWGALGYVLACLLVGISTYHRDLTPALNTFWRSRPIDELKLYWIKFFTGIGLMAGYGIALYLGFLATGFVDGWQMESDLAMWALTLTYSLSLYVSAVTITHLVRHGLYAAILSIAAAVGAWLVSIYLAWMIGVIGFGELRDDSTMLLPIIITGLVILSGVGILLGRFAAKHDWGWKKPN